MLTIHSWMETIGGGVENYSPVGGFFTPGELYLITGSLLGVFIYFSLFSLLLIWGYRNLLKGRPISLMRALPALSWVLIIGLREEYWVIGKMIIFWVWLFPWLAYRFSSLFFPPVYGNVLMTNSQTPLLRKRSIFTKRSIIKN